MNGSRRSGESITREGLAALRAELEELEGPARRAMAARIKGARELGDLKENAEYHAAREEQGLNEARIRVLEHHLANSEVREASGGGTVEVGSRVSYRDAGKKAEVTIVHALEADLGSGKISVESPIAKALLGHAAGDRVTVAGPRGERELEILSVA